MGTEYQYQYVRTDKVAENIDEYVIPECQPACKAFWDKNITTFMCSNYDELDDTKYVLIGGELSEENQEILERLLKENPEHYYYSSYRDAYGIKFKGSGEEVSRQLEELTKPFKIQDISEGKMTPESFLMDVVGLVKYVENPEFNKFQETHPFPQMENFDSLTDYIKALDEREKLEPPMRLTILDKENIEKSFEEYLQEYGYKDLYDEEEGIVFESEFYKNAHLRYLEYQKDKKENKKDTFENKKSKVSIGDLAKLSIQEEISMEDIQQGAETMEELDKCIEK